ncbi:MAG: EamA family transporter [Geminicoccaceae bacterium]
MGSAVAQARVMLVLTTLFWGGNAVAGKFAVGEAPPFLLSWFRWTIAALVLATFAWPGLRRDWPVIRANLPISSPWGRSASPSSTASSTTP